MVRWASHTQATDPGKAADSTFYRSPQEFEEATDSSDAASISIVAKLKFAH
jgi:hypothetical protein